MYCSPYPYFKAKRQYQFKPKRLLFLMPNLKKNRIKNQTLNLYFQHLVTTVLATTRSSPRTSRPTWKGTSKRSRRWERIFSTPGWTPHWQGTLKTNRRTSSGWWTTWLRGRRRRNISAGGGSGTITRTWTTSTRATPSTTPSWKSITGSTRRRSSRTWRGELQFRGIFVVLLRPFP